MKDFKQLIGVLSRVLGGIAAVVFLRAPFTTNGLALMAGSVIVGLVCLGGYMWSESDDDDTPLSIKDSK